MGLVYQGIEFVWVIEENVSWNELVMLGLKTPRQSLKIRVMENGHGKVEENKFYIQNTSNFYLWNLYAFFTNNIVKEW